MNAERENVINALNYLEAEGIVEKTYENGEAYYSLTKEGADMTSPEPTKKMTLKQKKALLLIR